MACRRGLTKKRNCEIDARTMIAILVPKSIILQIKKVKNKMKHLVIQNVL